VRRRPARHFAGFAPFQPDAAIALRGGAHFLLCVALRQRSKLVDDCFGLHVSDGCIHRVRVERICNDALGARLVERRAARL
jgi:hypothetical protein